MTVMVAARQVLPILIVGCRPSTSSARLEVTQQATQAPRVGRQRKGLALGYSLFKARSKRMCIRPALQAHNNSAWVSQPSALPGV